MNMGTTKKQNNRHVGAAYEQAAGNYLRKQGYSIIEYNYRCPVGEIDLIARDGEYLVFCEVKYRKDTRKGNPLEAVDAKKQRVIYKCALHYLLIHGFNEIPCRFDVIGFENENIIHIKDAFQKGCL